MRYETKSKIAYTIAACILITMIIAFGIVMYCLIKQGILPVNKKTVEPTTISTTTNIFNL